MNMKIRLKRVLTIELLERRSEVLKEMNNSFLTKYIFVLFS